MCCAAWPSMVHPPPGHQPSSRIVCVRAKSQPPPRHVGSTQSTNLQPPPSHVGDVQLINMQPPPRHAAGTAQCWKPHAPARQPVPSAQGVGRVEDHCREDTEEREPGSNAATSSERNHMSHTRTSFETPILVFE